MDRARDLHAKEACHGLGAVITFLAVSLALFGLANAYPAPLIVHLSSLGIYLRSASCDSSGRFGKWDA